MRRRVVDQRTVLLLLDDVWFRVEFDLLPKERLVESVVDGKPHRRTTTESRYDVVLHRNISRAILADRHDGVTNSMRTKPSAELTAGPKKIIRLKHSSLIERTNRSAKEFKLGERGGSRMT
jgi:hypothetical protein